MSTMSVNVYLQSTHFKAISISQQAIVSNFIFIALVFSYKVLLNSDLKKMKMSLFLFSYCILLSFSVLWDLLETGDTQRGIQIKF